MSAESPEIPQVPTIGMILAWLSVGAGILTALLPILPIVQASGPPSPLQSVYFVLLGLTGVVAGIGGLRSSPRSFYALWYVYAVQMFAYTSDSLHFNFMGPFSLTFGFGDYNPPSFVNINILAIVACLIALHTARVIARQSAIAAAATGV